MYKSKLQELCQRRRWELPDYSTVKEGPNHLARFTAVVNVRGEQFSAPSQCKSAKEAQNAAAQVAFDHFNAHIAAITSQLQEGSEVVGSSTGSVAANSNSTSALPQGWNHEDSTDASTVHRMSVSNDKKNGDILHIYKNLLQQYAAKKNLSFPEYTCEVKGPPHCRQFRSRISLNGESYETSEFFSTVKEAEQASAKVACHVLSIDVVQEDVGLYKNLLQEFAQKGGLVYPSYVTVASGLPHVPAFVSTVSIGNDTFQGAEAKSKKQAEMNAAKTAYYALIAKCSVTESTTIASTNQCAVADNLTQNIKPDAILNEQHDATVEDSPVTKSATVSSVDERVVADNLTPNIQPVSIPSQDQGATDDVDENPAKRAKLSMEVGAHLPGVLQQSNDPNLENSTIPEPSFDKGN